MSEELATWPDPNPTLVHYSSPEQRPRRSYSLTNLATSLSNAMGEIEDAEKDTKGNYGKYATLTSTWKAIRPYLKKHGLSVTQRIVSLRGTPTLCTMLLHSSGEFIDDCEVELIFDKTGGRLNPMQAMGSAITYARRYSVQGLVGVAPAEDDDGNGAGKPPIQPSGPLPKARPAQGPPADQTASKGSKRPAVTKPKGNFAPASDEQIEILYSLAIDRQVSEGVLNHLIQSYGVQPGSRPLKWIVDEIGKLLESEDTNEATLMAESQRVISRREAARIKAEAKKGGQP